LEYIALVSSSNDKEISENVVKVIKFVGKEGQVMIEPSYTDKTEIVEDNGYITRSGIFAQELLQETGRVKYEEMPVLVTDKKLYYKAEAETILQTVKSNGYDSLVIVASDFLNEAINYLIANHKAGKINLVLVKETDSKILEDIATYIGTDVISEKTGNLVDDMTIEQFGLAKSIFGGMDKVIISRVPEKDKKLDKRVKALRDELKEIGDKESGRYKDIERRIASLTRGMATIKVGGRTPLEVNEKIHRYEDAISAARVAIEEGYLVGGGVSMFHAFKKLSDYGEYNEVFRKVCYANLEQICQNAGTMSRFVIDGIEKSKSKTLGYNALTGELSDMLSEGIIEPFLVTQNVIKNSISIANIIISSRYLMLNDIEEEN
jgi:chaperonin GroEL